MSQLAVIFDVDGVLTDSYQPHFLSWQRMFGELDVQFTEDQFRGTFGRTNRDIFGELYQGGLTEEQIVRWGDRKEVLYREIIAEQFIPVPGAVELIDALVAGGFKLGVGSSGPPENISALSKKPATVKRTSTSLSPLFSQNHPWIPVLGAMNQPCDCSLPTWSSGS